MCLFQTVYVEYNECNVQNDVTKAEACSFTMARSTTPPKPMKQSTTGDVSKSVEPSPIMTQRLRLFFFIYC